MTLEHRHYARTGDGGAEGAGAGTDGSGDVEVEGAGIEGARSGGVAEDGPSDPLARALRVPGNVTEGSFRFQQFFFMYAKLMAGTRDSKVREYEITPRAMNNAVIKVGKSSREELDWAICEI